jgi:O-methyltransferase
MKVLNSILCSEKIENILCLLQETKGLPGCTAEVGVYKGGSSRFIAENNNSRMHYAYDTFKGIPNLGKDDNFGDGKFEDVDFEAVRAFLNLPNITIRPGIFPASAKKEKDVQFCFVHFDADTYESCKSVMEFFYPRLVQNGVIVFDDFGSKWCPGIKKAIFEYLEPPSWGLVRKIFNGQGVFRKK